MSIASALKPNQSDDHQRYQNDDGAALVTAQVRAIRIDFRISFARSYLDYSTACRIVDVNGQIPTRLIKYAGMIEVLLHE